MATLMHHRRKRGLALVEMALVLPLLFLLLFGLLEYGWLFFKYQQIASAARNGCRVGVAQGKDDQNVKDTVDAYMERAGLPIYETEIITVQPTPGVDVKDATPGSTVTVKVSVQYTGDGGIEMTGFPLLFLPDTLVGETSMVKEGAPVNPP